MDRPTSLFVDGLGAAAGTSGIITQLQGRIFALLYLQERPMPLEEIATELEQSKSTISVTIRGLLEWHLVRRVPVAGSRKDHYEAVANFWRLMQEIMERRFRWTVRQVLAAVSDAERAFGESGGRRGGESFAAQRLAALETFFTVLSDGLGAFAQGRPVDPETLKNVIPIVAARPSRRG